MDDNALGLIASDQLNPQKSRVLLQLCLSKTPVRPHRDTQSVSVTEEATELDQREDMRSKEAFIARRRFTRRHADRDRQSRLQGNSG